MQTAKRYYTLTEWINCYAPVIPFVAQTSMFRLSPFLSVCSSVQCHDGVVLAVICFKIRRNHHHTIHHSAEIMSREIISEFSDLLFIFNLIVYLIVRVASMFNCLYTYI